MMLEKRFLTDISVFTRVWLLLMQDTETCVLRDISDLGTTSSATFPPFVPFSLVLQAEIQSKLWNCITNRSWRVAAREQHIKGGQFDCKRNLNDVFMLIAMQREKVGALTDPTAPPCLHPTIPES
ncbi:hypothetical protein DMENIID0001_057800 [Sergentomyia squamirostris]